MLTYTDAVTEALGRLRGTGYEHSKLVNHAPMAAEALASLGYTDVVPTWVDRNLRTRRYDERPEPRWALSADDEAGWLPALGDFARVADWSAMFERELAERPWAEVLGTWWPRLLPGMSGVLTHGVIRTAHAVRSMARATGDDRLRRAELAHGLGYWAARYSAHVPPVGADREESPDDGEGALAALDELVADGAGHYARTTQRHPVPLIHAITGPAAVRLVCAYLPTDQHWPSYRAARGNSEWMRSRFGTPSTPGTPGTPGTPVESKTGAGTAPLGSWTKGDPEAASLGSWTKAGPEAVDAAGPDGEHASAPTEAGLVADAVEFGDEHAIKLAEVAVRHNALAPDRRYAVASHVATRRLRGFAGYLG